VNLSTKQIADPGLVPMVEDILARTHLPPHSLMFEITESAVMRDAESAATILSALKALGVMLAIDDFGTGYSSLAYLDKFPVDALKIDRSFVAMLDESASEPTLISGIVSLAHSLNLVVIAEGVESDYQAQILIELGVDALQGYLYGRPAPLNVSAFQTRLSGCRSEGYQAVAPTAQPAIAHAAMESKRNRVGSPSLVRSPRPSTRAACSR
jgi:EAL domain-containing protein (putative c-di-GMP-specific phosphodiesterase class I)